jgi:hypothetical protein
MSNTKADPTTDELMSGRNSERVPSTDGLASRKDTGVKTIDRHMRDSHRAADRHVSRDTSARRR